MGASRKKSKKPFVTKAESLLEETTFFIDRSLGRAIGAALRAAGLKVELLDDHFPEDAKDEDWLLEIGRKGWVVLTKDKGIRRKPAELQAVINANCRLFTLSNGKMTGREMAERYVASRARMGRFLGRHKAPFVAVVQSDAIELVYPSPNQDQSK